MQSKTEACAYDNVTGVSLQNTDVQELEQDQKSAQQNTD